MTVLLCSDEHLEDEAALAHPITAPVSCALGTGPRQRARGWRCEFGVDRLLLELQVRRLRDVGIDLDVAVDAGAELVAAGALAV